MNIERRQIHPGIAVSSYRKSDVGVLTLTFAGDAAESCRVGVMRNLVAVPAGLLYDRSRSGKNPGVEELAKS